MKSVKLPDEIREYFRKEGAKGGKLGGSIGGKKAAQTMTAEERKERARKAGLAASRNRKAKKKTT